MVEPDYVRRLRRANERIEFLKDRIKRWLKAQRDLLVIESNAATGEHVFKCGKPTGAVPDRIGMDIGECLFYLRSGLDHLAYHLGSAYSGPIPRNNPKELRKPKFPIF